MIGVWPCSRSLARDQDISHTGGARPGRLRDAATSTPAATCLRSGGQLLAAPRAAAPATPLNGPFDSGGAAGAHSDARASAKKEKSLRLGKCCWRTGRHRTKQIVLRDEGHGRLV